MATPHPATAAHPVRRIPLALAAGLAVVTWFESGEGTYTQASVAGWVVAMAAWCWAWWPETHGARRPVRTAAREVVRAGRRARAHPRRRRSRLASSSASTSSTRFRPTRPAITPRSSWTCTTSRGVRGLSFSHDNTGREPAQFYFSYLLIALGFKSLSFGMLKWGTAPVGTLAIPAVFLFADEVAGRVAGVAAAALYAVSAWPVETARAGLRFPYAQLGAALALWLAFRYLRTRDRRDALACGIAVAFGLHGYTAFKIVLFVIGGLLVLEWLMGRQAGETWRRPGGGGLIAGTALVASIPLARYAGLDHPDLVSYRASTRVDGGLGDPDELGGAARGKRLERRAGVQLARRLRRANAVTYAPLLDALTRAALLAGVVLLVHELVTRRTFRSAALLLAGPALMLSSARASPIRRRTRPSTGSGLRRRSCSWSRHYRWPTSGTPYASPGRRGAPSPERAPPRPPRCSPASHSRSSSRRARTTRPTSTRSRRSTAPASRTLARSPLR